MTLLASDPSKIKARNADRSLRSCPFGQPAGLWNLGLCGHITMGPTTDLILWHIPGYDKGLGVSDRPALGQGRGCPPPSQLQLNGLNLSSYFPRSLPAPVMRMDG